MGRRFTLMGKSLLLVAACLIQVACGNNIIDSERTTLTQMFAKHASGGKVPVVSLRDLVTDTIVASTATKSPPAVLKKHVDFLMTGFSAELKSDFTSEQLFSAVKKLELRDVNNPPSTPPKPECLDEGDKPLPKHIQKRLGSCKLKQLRAKLERNRLTMPLFDTLRWVRDFERSLEAMWEIYASGHDPMNIVVFPTDPREYRKEG